MHSGCENSLNCGYLIQSARALRSSVGFRSHYCEAVKKFHEEQANCKLRKVGKKAVKGAVTGSVQSNLQGDGFVAASAWPRLQPQSNETRVTRDFVRDPRGKSNFKGDLRSDPLMGWLGFTAWVHGPVASHRRKSAPADAHFQMTAAPET